MKKTICALLAASMLMGIVACSKEEPKKKKKKDREKTSVETTIEETTVATDPIPETTAAPTEETIIETEPVLPTEHECPVPLVNESLGNIVCDTVYLEYEGELHPFNLPYLMYETEDALTINNEINDLMSYVMEENDEFLFYYRSDMLLYTYGDFITIVLRIVGDWDMNAYYIWTVNDKTGTRVSNSDILSVANNHPSSVVEAVTNASVNFTNTIYDQGDGVPLIKDGAINPDHAYGSYVPDDAYSYVFSEENIYEDMMIGIDSDGCIIYAAEIISMGGAYSYAFLFNEDCFNLDDFFPENYSID